MSTRSIEDLSKTKKKSEWLAILVAHRVSRYPVLYAGHEDDAAYFVAHQYPNRYYMAFAAVNFGLVPL